MQRGETSWLDLSPEDLDSLEDEYEVVRKRAQAREDLANDALATILVTGLAPLTYHILFN